MSLLEYYRQFRSVLREEYLCEGGSVDLNSQGRMVTSHGHSGDHEIEVTYHHRHDTNNKPTGHHVVDFYTDRNAIGSGHHIPAHHKNNLMRHLGNSIDAFVKGHKPKGLIFQASSTDIDRERKTRQYRTAAEMIAKKYGGDAAHTNNSSHVIFPHN